MLQKVTFANIFSLKVWICPVILALLYVGSVTCETVRANDYATDHSESDSLADESARLKPLAQAESVEKSESGVQPELAELAEQDELTVRALRAWGELPWEFIQLAMDLRLHDVDLLSADLAVVEDLVLEAQKHTDLTPYADKLSELASLMSGFFSAEIVSMHDKPISAESSVEMQGLMSSPRRIAAGWAHTLILDDNGQAWAAGNNQFGQLGDGSDSNKDALTKVSMPDGVSFESVSAGGRHSLALDTAGHVWAWGNGEYGQLGNVTTESASRPVSVNLPEGITIIAIASRAGHSLALDTDGFVWAWGLNGQGRLGDGTTTNRSEPVRVSMPEDVRAMAIAAGSNHSLAIDTDGVAWAWGDGGGRLGNGMVLRQTRPVRVVMPDDTRFTSIAASVRHSVAIDQHGQAWAWGEAWRADGAGLGDGSSGRHLSPVRVAMPDSILFTAVAIGDSHNLALTDTGGIWAWGRNAEGQLGDDSESARCTPVEIVLPPDTRVGQIAAGAHHSIGLTQDGAILIWGGNSEGQLADTTTQNRHAPLHVQLP